MLQAGIPNRNHNHLPIRMRDPNSDVLPEKPIRFDEMKKIAAVYIMQEKYGGV